MPPTLTLSDAPTFGDLLKQLRKRAGLKQGELAALVGFSIAMISRLEQNERLPDLSLIHQNFVPALNLQEEPRLAQRLLELAAEARGERLPGTFSVTRQVEVVISDERIDPPSFLPNLPSEMIGRQHEVKLIVTRLQNHNGRLLTLIGPPGIGKTRLALAVARQMQHVYKDGVRFIPLAAISEAERIAAALVLQLGISDNSQHSAQRKLSEFLRHKEILLILDNFEQVIAASTLLAELLSACPGLHLLVTSRERLHLRAEQRYNVPVLPLAAAVALFVQRTQTLNAEFALLPQHQPVIEAICSQLDCLPLAIELAAGRVELFSPTQLLARLQDQRLDLLSDGAHDLPPQHRTLRNAIHRSYVLLATDEQMLFCALSVFVGSFAVEAVQAIGFTEYTFQSLLQKSLIHLAPAWEEQRRFLLLETLRDYVGEQLQTSGQKAAVRHRHAEYYLTLAEAAADPLQLGQQATWLQRLDAELENLRAAFAYFLDSAPWQSLALAGTLKEFWYTRGYFQEGRQWLTQSLSACQLVTLPDDASSTHRLRIRAHALLSLAQLAQNQGDCQQALQWVDESIALYRQLGEVWGTAEALRESGWVIYGLNQLQAAIARFEESLQLFRQVGDQAKIANLLTSLVHLQAGKAFDYAQSIAYLGESIALLRTTHDTAALCYALQYQAEIELQHGNERMAEPLLNESLQIARSLGMQRELSIVLLGLGKIKLHQGDVQEALGYAQTGLQIAQTLGDRERSMHSWCFLGHVQQALADFPRTKAAYTEALALCLALEKRYVAADCILYCGAIALTEEKYKWASQLFAATQSLLDILPPYIKPTDRTELLRWIERTRSAIGEDDFTVAWAIGQGWSFTQAVVAAQRFCLGG